jgi:hypothetical protein
MNNSKSYRYNAAECLRAARATQDYRRLYHSMAATWLLLARQDEAIENLFTTWRLSDQTAETRFLEGFENIHDMPDLPKADRLRDRAGVVPHHGHP